MDFKQLLLDRCLAGTTYIVEYFEKFQTNNHLLLLKNIIPIVQQDCEEEEQKLDCEEEEEDEPILKHKTQPLKTSIAYNKQTDQCTIIPQNIQKLCLSNTGRVANVVVNSEHVFAISMPQLLRHASKPLTLCFPGGFVFPVTQPIFKVEDDIFLNVVDFRSLYPTMMCRHNICMSTAGYHPGFKMGLPDGTLVEPSDEEHVSTYAVPIKVSGHMVNIVCYTLNKQQSIIKRVTMAFNKMRQEAKNKMKVPNIGLNEYDRLDAQQLTLKLVVNSMYGLYNSTNHRTYRPVLGALVTYMGRMSLVRLVYQSVVYFDKNNLDPTVRGVIYGDTDSIFLKAKEAEANAILDAFHALPCNDNFVVVEYEKKIEMALFFTKKHYIMRSPTRRYYTSKVFTFRVSPISNRFLYLLFEIIFDMPEDLNTRMQKIFFDFEANEAEAFKVRQKFSKHPSDYQNTTLLLTQYKHAISNGMCPTPTGPSSVQYTHYPFCFTAGPLYGPILPNTARLDYFLQPKNIRHTVLIDQLVSLFPDVKIAKLFLFVRDLKTELCKIFATLRTHPKHAMLKATFISQFEKLFATSDLIFNNNIGPVVDDEEEESILKEVCDELARRKRSKLTKKF